MKYNLETKINGFLKAFWKIEFYREFCTLERFSFSRVKKERNRKMTKEKKKKKKRAKNYRERGGRERERERGEEIILAFLLLKNGLFMPENIF